VVAPFQIGRFQNEIFGLESPFFFFNRNFQIGIAMTEKLVDRLGAATGLSKDEIRKTFEEVRHNHEILKACTRHQFRSAEYRFGKRSTCVNCGGTMAGERIAAYEEGVRHAGAPFKVWVDDPGDSA